MVQSPRKRKLPRNAVELPDREFMEKIFGKRIMKEVDALLAEKSEGVDTKEDAKLIRES